MKNYTIQFKKYILSKGLKFTPERKAILKAVFACHRHFDAEMLYEKARRRREGISLATIYRALPLLVESGLIKETLCSREKVNYERAYGHEHHDHMLCLMCGKVIEFTDNRIEQLQKSICKKYSFTAKDRRLGIRGYCKKCSSRIKRKEKLNEQSK